MADKLLFRPPEYRPAKSFELIGEYLYFNRLHCGLALRDIAFLVSLEPQKYQLYEKNKKPIEYDLLLKVLCVFSATVTFTEKEIADILKLYRKTERHFEIYHYPLDYQFSIKVIKKIIPKIGKFQNDGKGLLLERLAEYGPLLEKAINEEIIK